MTPRALAAFAADLTRAAATFTVGALIGDYATENRRLRAHVNDLRTENAVLEGTAAALARMVDDLARQAATAQRELNPPTFAQPITVGEFGDAMAVLETDDLTAHDLTWIWGNE